MSTVSTPTRRDWAVDIDAHEVTPESIRPQRVLLLRDYIARIKSTYPPSDATRL